MRISRKQAEENRARVIEEAERLFREQGFESVAVSDLMRAAGLTHGGFYNHFGSKSELEAEAVRLACDRSKNRIGDVVAAAKTDDGALDAYFDSYLSQESRDAPGARCAMAAYGSAMPRQGAAAQKAYADGVEGYVEALSRAFGEGPTARQAAIRTFASLIGGLYLARATAPGRPSLSDEILSAVRSGLPPRTHPAQKDEKAEVSVRPQSR